MPLNVKRHRFLTHRRLACYIFPNKLARRIRRTAADVRARAVRLARRTNSIVANLRGARSVPERRPLDLPVSEN